MELKFDVVPNWVEDLATKLAAGLPADKAGHLVLLVLPSDSLPAQRRIRAHVYLT